MPRSTLLLCALATLSACGGAKSTPSPEATAEATPGPDEAVAAEIEATLDRAVDPCDDFYAFACGGWMADFELPADRSRYSRSFSAISDRNQEIMKDILDNPGEGADARLGAYYGACMDLEGLEARGATALQADLDKIMAAEDAAALLGLTAELPLAGPFMGLFVEADFKNPDVNMAMVAQGGLGLPTRDDYFPQDEAGTSLLADYQTHVGNMLELAGLDRAGAEAVVAIETKLAEASRPPAALRDATTLYQPMDLAGMKETAPGMPWESLLAAYGLGEDITVNVMTPEFFPALASVLSDTSIEDLRTYVAWHLITGAAGHLPKAFDDENFAFYGTRLSGQKEQLPRWKRCVSRTDGALGDLLGQAFVDRAFAGDSKAKALIMIQDVEKAFEAGLPELSWMDDETRAKALDKVHAITNKIGYPDRWEAYEGLEVGDDPYANAMASAAWEQADSLADVGQPVDKTEWFMSPPTVNAYYNPLVNEIVFPAGIMQPPFFSADFPAAMNYGAMGMVMGHEITHGFDDEGRKFAPDGKLQEWWAPEVSEAFEGRAECVSETYAAIEVQPGVNLNGELTLGENIADFGGIKLAHRAFGLYKARVEAVRGLAGFTPEQLLFLGYAQSWCSEATPEVEIRYAKEDPHSPPRYRVNVPLSHLPAFWEAYSCEEGDAMRVAEACEVW